MEVVAIQFDVRDDEALPARVDRMCGLIADQRGADLVVLPELWPNGGFAYQTWAETAQPLDGAIPRPCARPRWTPVSGCTWARSWNVMPTAR